MAGGKSLNQACAVTQKTEQNANMKELVRRAPYVKVPRGESFRDLRLHMEGQRNGKPCQMVEKLTT